MAFVQFVTFDFTRSMRRLIMGNTTDKIAGAANQAAGKVKEGLGKATGSRDLETEGLAQEPWPRRKNLLATQHLR